MKFEDFSTDKQFATIINSESLQYIDLDTAFNCASKLLSNNGKWIITDYFRIIIMELINQDICIMIS